MSDVAFEFTEEEYIEKIDLLKREIGAGNVYQVNFTGRYRFGFQGSAAGLFHTMKMRQPSAYTAMLNTGGKIVLSFSPELFFRRNGLSIETMPMKGTAPRGKSEEEDLLRKEELGRSEKNRAENLMIVDLLRNDLGRICRSGSVEASPLFVTQTYPTLHQMVSTVKGEMKERVGLSQLFRSLFPSGSVTGAPKIRAMELIHALERSPRNLYTGAVGFILPDERMAFNVAIRTIELSGCEGIYGSGGGIVWDSDPLQEYHECLLKAKILSAGDQSSPDLFETILWNGAYLWLEDHLERLASSAVAYGYPVDGAANQEMLERLASTSFRRGVRYRVKMKLARSGEISVEHETFIPEPQGLPVKICLAGERVSSLDGSKRHKSSARGLHDRWYRAALAGGYQETLFMNERGEVTEGAISNVIIRKDGRYLTPPLSSGLLDGIYRRNFLKVRPWVTEQPLFLQDIRQADMLFLCNSLRGLRPAELIEERSSGNV
jgi:para-aminobenzoate synthetase/4-amino-4-deoxychorismate lyase